MMQSLKGFMTSCDYCPHLIKWSDTLILQIPCWLDSAQKEQAQILTEIDFKVVDSFTPNNDQIDRIGQSESVGDWILTLVDIEGEPHDYDGFEWDAEFPVEVYVMASCQDAYLEYSYVRVFFNLEEAYEAWEMAIGHADYAIVQIERILSHQKRQINALQLSLM